MHEKYMKPALAEARLALQNGEFPVGCVITDQDGVICRGRRKNSNENNEIDHAEMVALRRLYRKYPEKITGKLTIYATMEPCLMCFSSLILNNIRTIVFAYEDVMGGGTDLPLLQLKPLYASMDIRIIPHVLRSESIELFREFFADDNNGYWRDSQLAEYTLSQEKI
jgi:tRNA(adenine34) deaminase